MDFVQNKGQWNSKVKYRSDFITGSLFLEKNSFTVLIHNAEELQKLSEYQHGNNKRNPKTGEAENFTLHSFSYNVQFLGAAFNPENVPDKQQVSYNNYFIGNDEKQWASECKIYQAITYKDIYPNIDIRYYSTGDKLKYDFIVKPGGNPNQIAMRYDGGVNLSIKNKELIIATSVGTLKEMQPYTYQSNAKGRKDINAKFVVKDNVVSFNVENYDTDATLVIDPQLVFSTFSGSSQDNWGYTATPGPDGSFYSGGIVFGAGYPITPGAVQTQYNGGVPEGSFSGVDMAITKFSADGGLRLFSTYLGGGGNEQPHSLIVDAAGNLVIAGRTNSSNYPLRTNIPATGTNFDIIVTKLNATGTALIGSVRIGGSADDGVNIRPKYTGTQGADRLRRNYGDDARSEVIIDASNNIYLASCTQSANFPTLLAAQPAFGGTQDGVILKFTPTLSNLLFSTFFGGSGDDACFVAAINPSNGNLYVGGATSSGNLLGNTAGTIGAANTGGIDGFVTILPNTGASFFKTTYLGTGNTDLVYGLKFDKFGFPYVMGTTTGSWTITANAVYSVPGAKQFISKLQPDLSAYIYSTVFGTPISEPNISPVAFLVDRCENVYVSGWGGGINVAQAYSNGTTSGMPVVNPLTGIRPPDGADFYFFVLKKDAQSQLFGSTFGQFGGLGDHVDGGTSRFDANGVIYQALCANCGGRVSSPPIIFPITPGVAGPVNGSVSCNQASVKIDMNFAGVGAEIQSEIGGEINDTLGCISLVVNFKDLKAKGVTYYWNFNSTVNPNAVDRITTTPNTTFTFNTVGVFRVRLIAEDLNTCNLRDTSYINIRTGRDRALPNFTSLKTGLCTSKTFKFTNTSTSVSGAAVPFLPQTFVWDFGDNSPLDTTDFAEMPSHDYASTGTYPVKLTIIDPRFCNTPDSIVIPLRISDNVKAKPVTNELGCAPYVPTFKNESDAGLTWLWQLFDATTNALLQTSTNLVPVFTPLPIGDYKYRLIAYDSTTCNKIDTSSFKNIKVVQKPQASFTWAPNPPEPNAPVRFTNTASFSDTYLWNFGDGESSTLVNPTHEYNATGTYDAQLIAYSRAGCTDTFSLKVNVIVNPLLDVPNAFTPGRFGINSTVLVRGFGIDQMDWRIYNRWGQLVFKSNSKKIGWDGTFKGKLQPIDTYTYSLNVSFTDGKKLTKQGDIILLR
jgi:gliding motility-associated-like protein